MLYEPTDKKNYILITTSIFKTSNRAFLDSLAILDKFCIFIQLMLQKLVKSTNYQDPFLTALVKGLTLFVF